MKLKEYLLLLVIAVGIGFASCNGNDKDEPDNGISKIIIGEWDSEFYGDVSEININDLDVNDTRLLSVDSRLVFQSNSKGYEIDIYDGTKTEFSYTINGEILKMQVGNISQIHKILKYSENVVFSLMESEQIIFKMVKRQ